MFGQQIDALSVAPGRIAGRIEIANVVLLLRVAPGADGELARAGPAGFGNQQGAEAFNAAAWR